MFDMNFYTETAVIDLYNAAMTCLVENTPPTRSEELYAQQTCLAIAHTLMTADRLVIPAQIAFDDDVRAQMATVIAFYLTSRGEVRAMDDLRTLYGIAFD